MVRRLSSGKADGTDRGQSVEKSSATQGERFLALSVPIIAFVWSSNVSVVNSGITFSPTDLDIDADIDHDGRALSDSEAPPRKLRRIDSSNSDPETTDRERGHSGINPQSLAAASLRNPTDALNLLALAADVDRKTKSKSKHRTGADDADDSRSSLDGSVDGDLDGRVHKPKVEDSESNHAHPGSVHQHNSAHHTAHREPSLSTYALVRDGIVSISELSHLVKQFFEHAHAIFPMVSHYRIPREDAALARFASEEEPLLTAIVVIAARQEKMFDVHTRAWEYMQTLINELILGKSASLAAVEALLLLSGVSSPILFSKHLLTLSFKKIFRGAKKLQLKTRSIAWAGCLSGWRSELDICSD